MSEAHGAAKLILGIANSLVHWDLGGQGLGQGR